jgi:hypothetical protein
MTRQLKQFSGANGTDASRPDARFLPSSLENAFKPVTEHLARLEREHLVIRQGWKLIVCVDEIGNAITVAPSSTPDLQPYSLRKEQPFAA